MEQLSIDSDVRPKKPAKAQRRAPVAITEIDPVAQVVVDVHAVAVDRVFEYLVPESMAASAQRGVRVRVRFAGRLVNGFLLGRTAQPSHEGRLSPLSRVVGVPVLTVEIAELTRAVADRYAGPQSEILRDAIPARHAAAERSVVTRTERAKHPDKDISESARFAGQAWQHYRGGAGLLERLGKTEPARAALTVSPGDDPAALISDLVSQAGGGAIVVVPDARDLHRFAQPLHAAFGGRVAELTAAAQPPARYATFLDVHAGVRDIVVGTRNAVFAPVRDLRLLVLWDDGDENLAEPRSPGWHAREVLSLRSHGGSASLVIAGHSRSVEVARLVSSGWLRSVVPQKSSARDAVARVVTAADGHPEPEPLGVRMPHFAWRVIHDGIRKGPVLVQVARSGYVTALACQQCRTPAQCQQCSGPLARASGSEVLSCRWCGAQASAWTCPSCGSVSVHAMSIGSSRTAEELARAFPDVPVLISGRAAGVIDEVGPERAIVVATVGAEPVARNKYQAAVLLDGSALLARSDLRSEEETVRRWFSVLALVRGSEQGGKVAVTAEPAARAVQALVRLDPDGWADRELAERRVTGLPPATRAASVAGNEEAVAAFLGLCELDREWRTFGPVPATGSPATARALVMAPLADGPKLARVLKDAMVATPDRGPATRVRVRIDPLRLLG